MFVGDHSTKYESFWLVDQKLVINQTRASAAPAVVRMTRPSDMAPV